MTPREKQIVDLLLLGYDNKGIAKELKIATNTVKQHLRVVYARKGLTGSGQRVRLAVQIFREKQT